MSDLTPDIKEPGVIHDLRQENDDNTITIAEQEFVFVESVREEKLKSYNFRKKCAAVIIPIVTPFLGWFDWLLLNMQRSGEDGGFGLTVVFLGILWAWVNMPKHQYRKIYKKTFMPKIVKSFGNFKYDIKGKIPERLLLLSKILPEYDRYTSEDYFEGLYKNTKIMFSEIDLAVKRRNKNRTYYHSVFKGLAILFENPGRKFYGHTVIDQNTSSMMEWFKEKSFKLKRANLVDPVFEGKYDVYTNDQVEARYLVHPATVEKLNDLAIHYAGQKLTAAFYQDKFLIMISSNENHFEPADITVPATSKESLYALKKEIEDILSIGDQLELYAPKWREIEGQPQD